MKKPIYFKKIDFPFFRASIQIMDISKLKGIPILGAGYTTILSKDENGNIEIGVFIQDIESSIKDIKCMPFIFHEIIHALQYLCEERGIDMEKEKECISYLGSYIMEQLTDNVTITK